MNVSDRRNQPRNQPATASRRGRIYIYWGLFILLVTVITFALTAILQGSAQVLNPANFFSGQLESPEVALEVVLASANLVSVVLSITITVVAIIVELAANRYSHRITSLFVREPVNIVVMVYLVVATVYSLWIAMIVDAERLNPVFVNAGLALSLVLISVALIILLPYFAFVMSFLSPVNVISKIRNTALASINRVDSGNMEVCKDKLLNAIDDLQDITRRASEVSDRAVESASINALYALALRYQDLRHHLQQVPGWYQLTAVVRDDPDFVSLFHSSLQQIEDQGLWVETKLLRQYMDLMIDDREISRDISYLIGINTRKIAVSAFREHDNLDLVRLCIQCFNSYLRSTINKGDPRTCYYIMNQYRMLAENLLQNRHYALVTEITLNFQFYGILAFKKDQPFILEVAAQDIMTLIASARPYEDQYISELLQLFLDLDQKVRKDFHEDTLHGVRRAQIKLAVYFLDSDAEVLAERICLDMEHDDKERLSGIIRELDTEDRPEYWEFTDRGVNFAYLEPALRKHLPRISELLALYG